MIPENDPFVESQVPEPDAFLDLVKRLSEPYRTIPAEFPIGRVEGFELGDKIELTSDCDKTMFAGTVTKTDGTQKTMSIDDINRMLRDADAMLTDQDVKLIEALKALGALISIQTPIMWGREDGPIVVSLPPRFQNAMDKIEMKRRRREQAIDASRYYTGGPYLSGLRRPGDVL
jgi:hypothetical protein